MGPIHSMLGCGPYFEPSGLIASFVLFLLVKPLSYFAFVRAFRFRVCREIPMTGRRAAALAALRAGLGLVLVGGGAAAFVNFGRSSGALIGWVYLFLARATAWWIVGRVAGLRGRRMIGWIVSGEAINVAFDVAVVAGLWKGAWAPAIAVALIVALIYWLETRGRRPELQARFSSHPACRKCQYNLTGNLSGICPECGTTIISGFQPQRALH